MDAFSQHLLDTARLMAQVEAPRVTRYVIRLHEPDVYVAPNRHYESHVAHARRFASMTAALAYAVLDLGLANEAFSVETV